MALAELKRGAKLVREEEREGERGGGGRQAEGGT